MITSPKLSSQTREVATLFDEKPPVLVEVRFPGMGTSPDWYFCREEEELDAIISRLGVGVSVHLHSVWDLSDSTQGVILGQ
jgi:hypothetical protein